MQIKTLKSTGTGNNGIGVPIDNWVFENNTVAGGFIKQNFDKKNIIGYYMVYFQSISSTVNSIICSNISFVNNEGSGF